MKRLGKKLVRYEMFQLIRTKHVNKLTEKWTKTRDKKF